MPAFRRPSNKFTGPGGEKGTLMPTTARNKSGRSIAEFQATGAPQSWPTMTASFSPNNFTNTLPGLRGCHIIEGAGHWIQRERASAVNDLLIKFLKGL